MSWGCDGHDRRPLRQGVENLFADKTWRWGSKGLKKKSDQDRRENSVRREVGSGAGLQHDVRRN